MIRLGSAPFRMLIVCFAVFGTTTTSNADDPPTLQWIRQFGTAGTSVGVRGVSADALGNLFVAGDFSVARGGYLRNYDYDGNLQWSYERRPVEANEAFIAFDVWADGLGNAYWVGGHGPTDVTQDPFVFKFDSTGDVLWNHEIPTTGNASFHAVTGDALGSIYMAGINPAEGFGSSLSKYGANGDLIWSRPFSLNGVGYVTDTAADGLGSIFVSGFTGGSLGGPNPGDRTYDGFLRKFNDAGEHVWTRQFGGTNHDYAECVAADGSGNVFVAGHGQLPTSVDGFVRKYDSNGNLVWNRQIGRADIRGIVSDGYGNIYVAGPTDGNLGAPHAGEGDAFVRKYDAAGNVLWTYQLGTSKGEGAEDIALDGQGGVIIAGQTRGSLGGPKVGIDDVWVALLREYNAGDYNADDVVDDGDHAVWSAAFGSTHDLAADGNRNGVIDAADYVIWRNNFGGNTSGNSATTPSVPEPSAIVLAAFSLVAIACGCRRCQRVSVTFVIRPS